MASIIEELRELEARATPAPWAFRAGEIIAPKAKNLPNDSPTFQAVSCVYQRDAALIAAMRNALPALLARLEALEAVAEALRVYRRSRTMDEQVDNGERMVLALAALEALP